MRSGMSKNSTINQYGCSTFGALTTEAQYKEEEGHVEKYQHCSKLHETTSCHQIKLMTSNYLEKGNTAIRQEAVLQKLTHEDECKKNAETDKLPTPLEKFFNKRGDIFFQESELETVRLGSLRETITFEYVLIHK